MTNPFSVEVGEEVNPDRISGRDVVLYGAIRIYGAKTVISPGARLGYEGPVTVEDCFLGPQVELKGGFFRSSVFLEKVSISAGAHIREGCLLEEEATLGHTVGLKQTILFPFVTLGSLINFCDCLLAGGTSRKNHSEVGSSYVHFNFTPQGDKATASLLGDVPDGVMLDQPPIFLGGQGGLVGPARIGYGTVIPAGTIYRGDAPEGGKLLAAAGGKAGERDFRPGLYGDINRKVHNNIIYLANLLALRQWYIHVRGPFFDRQELGGEVHAGALETLAGAIAERKKRLRDLAHRMEESLGQGAKKIGARGRTKIFRRQREFGEKWPAVEKALTAAGEEAVALRDRDVLLTFIQTAGPGAAYLDAIRELDGSASRRGSAWLRKVVGRVVDRALAELPSFRQ